MRNEDKNSRTSEVVREGTSKKKEEKTWPCGSEKV
jgi:hypothetical protein